MKREYYIEQIQALMNIFPIVALLGPRQVGKTTIAKQFRKFYPENESHFFDLEDPDHLAILANPKLILDQLKGLIIIDEIQNKPELFQLLRVLADNNKHFQKYLILGSAAPSLIRKSSESLAGRVGFIEVTPFSYEEVGGEIRTLWQRGGFPESYLGSDYSSIEWRKNYVRTFLERDLPALGIQIQPAFLRKFWTLLAHYHGCVFNASEIGAAFGASYHTMKSYLQILEGTFVVRQLAPWYENISKRQIKSPKIYIRDSGLLNYLLQITSPMDLISSPKIGALFEGFCIEEIIKLHRLDYGDCYYWATISRAELDLMIFQNGKRIGFEIKYTDAPKITASMRIAMEDLKLDFLNIIVPGEQNIMMDKNIRLIGIAKYLNSSLSRTNLLNPKIF